MKGYVNFTLAGTYIGIARANFFKSQNLINFDFTTFQCLRRAIFITMMVKMAKIEATLVLHQEQMLQIHADTEHLELIPILTEIPQILPI